MKLAAQTSACSGGRGRGKEATGGMKQRGLGIANHSYEFFFNKNSRWQIQLPFIWVMEAESYFTPLFQP